MQISALLFICGRGHSVREYAKAMRNLMREAGMNSATPERVE